MAVPLKHVLHQRRGILGMLQIAGSALTGSGAAPDALPGPVVGETVSPPADALLDDAVRWAGGDPKAYKDTLPPWMFAYWGVPLFTRMLADAPVSALQIINQGCRIRQNHPLPRGQALELTGQLVEVREEPRRVRMHIRLTTGTGVTPDAQVVDLYTMVPRKAPKGEGGPRKSRGPAVVDSDWIEVAEWHNGPSAGFEFAKLTGDFNPIHWIPLAARASGFKNVILHGFGTVARAMEHLARHRWAEGMSAFEELDIRVTAPVTLPGSARLYLGPVSDENHHQRGIAVGKAPGGRAFVVGTLTTR